MPKTIFLLNLLYVGFVILKSKKIFSKQQYANFIKFASAMRLLISTKTFEVDVLFCSELLKKFCNECLILYGKSFMSYNVHSVIHLVEDFKLFGSLDNVCCFPFESYLGLIKNYVKSGRRRHRLKGIHSRSDTNRTGAEGLSFYYPRLLHCLDQMLAVMLLSQHRVSSSKTVRPRAPCGARCMGHIVSTWSAVCSEAPHSQFGEGARPHLCMDEWNRLTPVRRRLSLTQAARGKPIPTGLTLVPGTKARSLEAFSQYSAFHL